MKRCTIIIPDAGPINSLWVVDRLDLLLKLDMRVIVVDAVYDELTSDLSYQKDHDVKAFIDQNQPPFTVETTEIGAQEREKRRNGVKPKKNAGELAIVDFMSSDDGLRKYLNANEPVVILFEDAAFRFFYKPSNLHLLSTVGMLRGLESVGVIPSANDIIYEMMHPSKLYRRLTDARAPTDLPDGIDEPADTGSNWLPVPGT